MTDLDAHLDRLTNAGLLRQVASHLEPAVRADPVLEYLFRHALVQEAAYASLLRGDRKRLHALVGQIVEAGDAGGSPDRDAVLAHHFQLAGETERAQHYFTRAGNHALAIYSNAEAATHYSAALLLTPAPEDQAALLAGRAEAQARQGLFPQALADYRATITIYTALPDTVGLARTYGRLVQTTYDSGDVRAALAVCHAALAAVTNHAASADDLILLNAVARIYYFNGLVADAHIIARRMLDLAQQLGHQEGEITALLALGTVRDESLVVAAARLATAGAQAQAAGLLLSAATALHNQAVVLWELGDLPAAYDCVQRSITVYRAGGLTGPELHALGTLIYTAVWLGDFAGTAAYMDRLRRLAAQVEPRHLAALVVERIEGTLAGYQGDHATADSQLRAAIANAQRTGNLQVILTAARDLTWLLGEQGRWASARSLLLEVVPLTDRHLLFDRVWARARLSEVAAALGDLAQARHWLAAAREVAATPPTRPEAAALALATAHLAAVEGRPAALAAYAEAAAVQAQMGAHRQRAATLRAWAAIARIENPRAAQALLAEARTLFVAMNLPSYVAQIDADRAALL